MLTYNNKNKYADYVLVKCNNINTLKANPDDNTLKANPALCKHSTTTKKTTAQIMHKSDNNDNNNNDTSKMQYFAANA